MFVDSSHVQTSYKPMTAGTTVHTEDDSFRQRESKNTCIQRRFCESYKVPSCYIFKLHRFRSSIPVTILLKINHTITSVDQIEEKGKGYVNFFFFMEYF